MTVPAGFIDVKGPLLGDGAFYWGVTEDGVHLSVLDKGVAQVLDYGLGLPLALTSEGNPGLRTNSRRYPSLTRSWRCRH